MMSFLEGLRTLTSHLDLLGDNATFTPRDLFTQLGLKPCEDNLIRNVLEATLMLSEVSPGMLQWHGYTHTRGVLCTLKHFSGQLGVGEAVSLQREVDLSRARKLLDCGRDLLQVALDEAQIGESLYEHKGIKRTGEKTTLVFQLCQQIIMVYLVSRPPHAIDRTTLLRILTGNQSNSDDKNVKTVLKILTHLKFLRRVRVPTLGYGGCVTGYGGSVTVLQATFPCRDAVPPLTEDMLAALPKCRGVATFAEMVCALDPPEEEGSRRGKRFKASLNKLNRLVKTNAASEEAQSPNEVHSMLQDMIKELPPPSALRFYDEASLESTARLIVSGEEQQEDDFGIESMMNYEEMELPVSEESTSSREEEETGMPRAKEEIPVSSSSEELLETGIEPMKPIAKEETPVSKAEVSSSEEEEELPGSSSREEQETGIEDVSTVEEFITMATRAEPPIEVRAVPPRNRLPLEVIEMMELHVADMEEEDDEDGEEPLEGLLVMPGEDNFVELPPDMYD